MKPLDEEQEKFQAQVRRLRIAEKWLSRLACLIPLLFTIGMIVFLFYLKRLHLQW